MSKGLSRESFENIASPEAVAEFDRSHGGDMVAFGASDAACYKYPGEDQAVLRAAFCEGAASAGATAGPLKKRPVAWRCRDFGDGWIIYQDEAEAFAYHEKTNCLMQGLYVRDGS